MRKKQSISVPTADIALPEIHDERRCDCGESPLWHPVRKQLFWVDITNHNILTRKDGKPLEIQFSEFVTALAWIDEDHLLAATETQLLSVNIDTHALTHICPVEDSSPQTRSNDGRADPWGGFWISTMGKSAEKGLGKIYRYYNGELSTVVDSITIPNAICFDQSRGRSYFADTSSRILYSMSLDPQTGTPSDPPEVFADFSETDAGIDGAIVDSTGHIWIGVWDGAEIIKLSPDGHLVGRYAAGAQRPTCAAFGGSDYKDIFVTTAAIGLEETFETVAQQGRTLVFRNITQGQAEPPVKVKFSFNC